MNVRAGLFAACLVGGVVAVIVGGSWSDRLSDHRGLYLVPVQDEVTPTARAALAARLPRRTRIVVFDGLGVEEASGMPALSALRTSGQCLRTYVGTHSVSQPVYAVISTGLEQDRTGARNNEPLMGPVRAESIWTVARQAGLSVSAISELDWFDRLFPPAFGRPAAFSPYVIPPRAEDFLAQAPLADLMLIHPIYVDETGHSFGAASAQYHQAVARADTELGRLTASLDLERELLVVTADHGHTLRGGHGGDVPRVTHVLTCYAGPGVRHDAALGEMRATSVAPSLAVLLGLRFPLHMRAGADADDDGLDVLWRIADPAAFPAEYLADRKQAVARFREENRAQLRRWPGGHASWRDFYQAQRGAQHRREILALAAALVALGLFACYPTRPGGRRARDAALCAAWVAAVYLACYLLTVLLRGSFDPNGINQRLPFIYFSFELSAAVLACAALLHGLLRRSLPALRADALALLIVTILINLGHPAVFGWHLGFPVPAPVFIYLPYFSGLFLLTLSGLALPLCLNWAGLHARRGAREETSQ